MVLSARKLRQVTLLRKTGHAVQGRKVAFEEEAMGRAGGAAGRYGQQEVCPLSGVIVNKEESRMRDHKNGRNYRWVPSLGNISTQSGLARSPKCAQQHRSYTKQPVARHA